MSEIQILSALNGSDSKNPMALRILKDKVGMDMGPLIEIVEEMYAARSINKCIVSKHGVTQIMVWPTGVVSKSDPKKIFRDYPTKEEALEEELIVEKEKSKTQILLELIAEKGSVTTAELSRVTGITAVKAFLDRHVKNGSIGYDQASKTYHAGQMIAPTETENPVAEQKQEVEVHPRATNPVVVNKSRNVIDKPRFRLARTSDGTLMLFGLGSEPIELDQEQTELLIKFVSAGVAAHG